MYSGLVYLSTVITVIVLPFDFLLLMTTLDPGFTLYFVLVSTVFVAKLYHVVICYMIMSSTQSRQYIVYVGISLIIIFLTFLLLVVELVILTQDILSILTNPFAIDFFFLTVTGIYALLYNLNLGYYATTESMAAYNYPYVYVTPKTNSMSVSTMIPMPMNSPGAELPRWSSNVGLYLPN